MPLFEPGNEYSIVKSKLNRLFQREEALGWIFNTAVLGSMSLLRCNGLLLLYLLLGCCGEVVYVALPAAGGEPRLLNGPVCPIYGFGVVAVLWLLRRWRDNLLLLFFAGGAVASAVGLGGRLGTVQAVPPAGGTTPSAPFWHWGLYLPRNTP